jgi:hypothetical protein
MRLMVVGVGLYGRDVRNVLRDRGVTHIGPSDPMGEDCVVVLVASRPALAVAHDLDRSGQAFLPVWGHHGRLQVGPLVAPGGPCFACFEARERQHATDLVVHDAISAHWLRAVVPPPTAALRKLTKIAGGEVAALRDSVTAPGVDRVPAELHGVVRRYAGEEDVVEGRVVPMHGCQRCGTKVPV